MRRFLVSLLLFCSCMSPCISSAQRGKTDTADNSDDLMSMLNEGDDARVASSTAYTAATFKATRIINSHSVETTGKGVLDFRVAHRFGALNAGTSTFFGLDNARTKLSFDFGITDWLMIGFGRSTLDKEYDGYLKAKLYRQTEDGRHPLTVSYLAGMSAIGGPAPAFAAGREYYFSNRLHYFHQLLLARKFSKRFSLQLMPTLIHYNMVPTTAESNNTIAIGAGGRMKLSNRIALTGEYYFRLPDNQLEGYHNSASVGLDIETGGHVFQVFFTNSLGMTERTFIGQTTDTWGFSKTDGIHFGFNISRVFTIIRPKEFEGSNNKIW